MRNVIIVLGILVTACGKTSGGSDSPVNPEGTGSTGNSSNAGFNSKVLCIKEHGGGVTKTSSPSEIAKAFVAVSKSCDIDLAHIEKYFGD